MNRKRRMSVLAIIICMMLILFGGTFFHNRNFVQIWTKDMFNISEIKDGYFSSEELYAITPHQGLEKGNYSVTISYDAEVEGSYVDVFSYYQRQDSYIDVAPYYMETDANQGVLHFTLKENVDDVSIRFWYGGSGDLSLNGAVLERDTGFTDYYYVIVSVCIVFLCIFLQLRHKGTERLCYLAIWASIGMVSIPLLKEGIALGFDMIFHVNRIEGIYRALQGGNFPVRIQASQFGGYGYAASIFYPDLFLYIPALFRFLGMSLSAANELFIFSIQIAAGWTMYYSAKKIFNDTKTASLSAIFYIFATYRVFNIYSNYAMGANIAAVFLPLVVLGLYELTLGDKNNWTSLVIGCTGVFQSHIITTLLVIVFGGMAIILAIPRIIKEKRIMAFVKAGIAMVVLNLWFLLPFLQFQQYKLTDSMSYDRMEGVDVKDFFGIDRIYRYLGLSEASVLMENRFNLIFIVVIGILIAICMWVKNRKMTPTFIKGAIVLILAATALVGNWFPWDKLPTNIWLGYLQFPVRLCMVIEVLGSMVAAYGLSKIKRFYKTVYILASCWCVISFSNLADDYFESEAFFVAGQIVNTYIPQEEYLFGGTDKKLLIAGQISAANLSYDEYSKDGTTINMSVENNTNCNQMLEVPLLYYPGYAAELDGVKLPVSGGNNNILSVCITPNSSGYLKIWYRGFGLWHVANAISIIGWLVFVRYLLKRKFSY